jgi:hypothetical protein
LEGIGKENGGILCGHLEHITAIWHILWPFGNLAVIWHIFPVLVYFTKKNLATLETGAELNAISLANFESWFGQIAFGTKIQY